MLDFIKNYFFKSEIPVPHLYTLLSDDLSLDPAEFMGQLMDKTSSVAGKIFDLNREYEAVNRSYHFYIDAHSHKEEDREKHRWTVSKPIQSQLLQELRSVQTKAKSIETEGQALIDQFAKYDIEHHLSRNKPDEKNLSIKKVSEFQKEIKEIHKQLFESNEKIDKLHSQISFINRSCAIL